MGLATAIAPAFAAACCMTAASAAVADEVAAPLLPVQDTYPHISRDGRVVFQSKRLGGQWKLFVARLDGSDLRNVTNNPGSDSHPSWSPDGGQIVFCSLRDDGENDDVYVVDADGANVRQITDNRDGWDTFPSFSPDGRRILFRRLFMHDTDGVELTNSEIFVMMSDGSAPTRVVTSAYTDVRPQWLPDGSGLVFNREREGRTELWQVRLPPAMIGTAAR